MKGTLKVFSWICVVLGALAMLTAVLEGGADAGYAFVGGGLFLTEGILALNVLGELKK